MGGAVVVAGVAEQRMSHAMTQAESVAVTAAVIT
jgi:hypothetical protein